MPIRREMASLASSRFSALLLLVASLSHAAPTCHFYLGDLGAGQNIGNPVAAQTHADCCAACLKTSGCGSFTFTAPSASGCYLHPVGALGDNNAGSSYVSGVCGDDDAQFGDPRVLVNITASRTGVPLGGMGVGFFDITPDGSFGRVAINNWHQDGVLTDVLGSFLAAWAGPGRGAQLLQRPSTVIDGLRPAGTTSYTGLFPVIDLTVNDGLYAVHAWSPLVPHDGANSSLPLAYIDVTLFNTEATARPLAAAFSWQDVIARAMFDASPQQLDKYYPTGDMACAFATDGLRNAMGGGGVDVAHSLPRVATASSYLTDGAAGIVGVRQHSVAGPLTPNKFTLQHYVHEVGIAAEVTEADVVSFLPSYTPGDAASASAAWASFVANGTFAGGPSFSDAPLFAPGGPEHASAVAVRAVVPAAGNRTVRFLLSWFAAPLTVQPGQDPRTHCGTSDYNHAYHNRFTGVGGVLAFAVAARDALHSGTSWIGEAFAASTLPGWLSFKIVNSAYTLFTNTLYNQAGDFSVMEGGMGGLAGEWEEGVEATVNVAAIFRH